MESLDDTLVTGATGNEGQLSLDLDEGEAPHESPKKEFPGEKQLPPNWPRPDEESKGDKPDETSSSSSSSSSGFKALSGKENNYRVPTSRMRGRPGENTSVELGDGELLDDEVQDSQAAGADVLFDLPTLG